MKKPYSIRMTKAQERQIAALENLGFGNRTMIITTAIDRMYRQEVGEPVINSEVERLRAGAKLSSMAAEALLISGDKLTEDYVHKQANAIISHSALPSPNDTISKVSESEE